MKDVRSVSKINKKWMRKISQTTALSSINNQFTFTAKMTSIFIQDSETPGCECGWIWVDTSPEMRTRQEMVPHISKTDLEFNDVWMDERVGGGNNTTNKIISRDSWGKKIIWVEVKREANQDCTWDHIKSLACQWFGEYWQDTFPKLHLASQIIPPLRYA